MKVRFAVSLLVTFVSLSSIGHAVLPSSVIHVVEVNDSSGPLIEPTDHQALESKLARFEKAQNIRVLLQFHLHSPSADEDKIPGAYMRGLAKTLGTDGSGVLVVYFADDDDWRVWLGDEIAPQFVGRRGTAKELTENGAIHEAKEALLTESRSAGESAFDKIQQVSGLAPSVMKKKRLRVHADALLDRLFTKIVPE